MDLLLLERIAQVRPRWFTTAFWVILLVSIYWLTFNPNWEWGLVLAALGGAANYGWWRVRRPQQLGIVWAMSCGLITTVALIAAVNGLMSPFLIATESVGDDRVDCGSVVNPVPVDELFEMDGASGEPVIRARPIPQSEFTRVCNRDMEYRISNAAGATVIGLLFSVRATGHVLRRPGTVRKRSDARLA